MGERALELSTPADAKEARKLLARAREPKAEDARILRAHGLIDSEDSPAMEVTRFAVRTAATIARGKDDQAWVSTASAAARMVPIVREADASVVEFLRELDRRISAE